MVAAFTFTRNYIGSGLSVTGHLWSLSLEEQFYACWPALFVAFAPAEDPKIAVAVLVENAGFGAAAAAWAGQGFPVQCIVAAVIAGHGLTVHRLLHPIVRATREGGKLIRLGEGAPESIIYVELDRADARGRRGDRGSNDVCRHSGSPGEAALQLEPHPSLAPRCAGRSHRGDQPDDCEDQL